MTDPRVFWGRIVKVFIEQGWRPPRPNERATHAILDDVQEIQPEATLELSDGETRFLQMLADGASYDECAVAMDISHETVRQYQKRTFRRLGARNAPHAVAIGFRRGTLE